MAWKPIGYFLCISFVCLCYGRNIQSEGDNSYLEKKDEPPSWRDILNTEDDFERLGKLGVKLKPLEIEASDLTAKIGKTDPCEPNPCQNEGACAVDGGTKAKCTCVGDFIGDECETADPCKPNPCQNEGTCAVDGTKAKCTCVGDFIGDECETAHPCIPNPCRNGGTCTLDGVKAVCKCTGNFSGKNCEDDNPCKSNPCLRGGTCSNNGTHAICKCTEDFIGDKCEIGNPCKPQPCKNNGICTLEGVTDVCKCTEYYTGDHCEKVQCKENCTAKLNEECRDDEGVVQCYCKEKFVRNKIADGTCHKCECAEHEVCKFIDARGNNTCNECKEGYERIKSDCIVKSPCNHVECKNGGTCLPNGEDDHNCTCTDGYIGKNCELIEWCEKGGKHLCQDNCQFDEDLKSGICRCNGIQYYDFVSGTCKDTDFCLLKEACEENKMCRDNTCVCKENYKVDPKNNTLCILDFCAKKSCPKYTHCDVDPKKPEDWKCTCKDETEVYNGEKCIAALCLPGVTKCNHICIKTSGECDCFEGYKLNDDNHTCEASTDEVKNCNLTCDGSGVCVKDGEKFECQCLLGYDGEKCESVCKDGNETKGMCPASKCILDQGNLKCICEGKYKYHTDTATCIYKERCGEDDKEAKEKCKESNSICIPKLEDPQGFTCACDKGYENVTGVCTEKCKIRKHKLKCLQENKICFVRENGSTGCKCKRALEYTKDDNDTCKFALSNTFEVELPIRKKSYIMESGGIDEWKLKMDVVKSLSQAIPANPKVEVPGSCQEQDDLLVCKAAVITSDAADVKDIIERLVKNSSCVPYDNTEFCLLASTLPLKIEEFSKVERKFPDLCADGLSPCEPFSNCNASESSVECSCFNGFKQYDEEYIAGNEHTIPLCRDTNECAENPNICDKANTTCENTLGDFYCKCKSKFRLKVIGGYMKENKEACIGLCDGNPCNKGDCVEKGEHNFSCSCHPGVTGEFCNTEDSVLKKSQSNLVVVGAVLGTILALTLIVFYITVRKLKKRKDDYMDDIPATAPRTDAEMAERPNYRQGVSNRAYE